MIAARTVRGPANWRMIEEMERELTKVIEDFDRAVNVETLHRTREIGEYSFLRMIHSQCCFVVEQDLLLGRLKSIETNYHQDSRCMDGTRDFLLKQVIGCATKEPGQKEESNIYWIYGL